MGKRCLEQWMERDENFKDFDDIYQSQTYSDITWRVKIKGSLESTSFFTKEIRSLLVI
jgi:hypothetical protein